MKKDTDCDSESDRDSKRVGNSAGGCSRAGMMHYLRPIRHYQHPLVRAQQSVILDSVSLDGLSHRLVNGSNDLWANENRWGLHFWTRQCRNCTSEMSLGE